MLIPFYRVSPVQFIGDHSVILHEYFLPLFSPMDFTQNPAPLLTIIHIEGGGNIPSQSPMPLDERPEIFYANLSPYRADRESFRKIDRISLL